MFFALVLILNTYSQALPPLKEWIYFKLPGKIKQEMSDMDKLMLNMTNAFHRQGETVGMCTKWDACVGCNAWESDVVIGKACDLEKNNQCFALDYSQGYNKVRCQFDPSSNERPGWKKIDDEVARQTRQFDPKRGRLLPIKVKKRDCKQHADCIDGQYCTIEKVCNLLLSDEDPPHQNCCRYSKYHEPIDGKCPMECTGDSRVCQNYRGTFASVDGTDYSCSSLKKKDSSACKFKMSAFKRAKYGPGITARMYLKDLCPYVLKDVCTTCATDAKSLKSVNLALKAALKQALN